MSKINNDTIYSVAEVAQELGCSDATVKNKCVLLYKTNGRQYVDKIGSSGVWVIKYKGIDKIKNMIKSVGRPSKNHTISLNKRKINKSIS